MIVIHAANMGSTAGKGDVIAISVKAPVRAQNVMTLIGSRDSTDFRGLIAVGIVRNNHFPWLNRLVP